MPRATNEYKYNVASLAEDLDIEPGAVRARLRTAEIDKNEDGVYGWDNQRDYKAVLEKLKEVKPRGPHSKTAKENGKKAKANGKEKAKVKAKVKVKARKTKAKSEGEEANA